MARHDSRRDMKRAYGRYSGYGGSHYGRREFGPAYNEHFGGEGHRGRGPKGYARSDDRIREDICDWLTYDSHLGREARAEQSASLRQGGLVGCARGGSANPAS